MEMYELLEVSQTNLYEKGVQGASCLLNFFAPDDIDQCGSISH